MEEKEGQKEPENKPNPETETPSLNEEKGTPETGKGDSPDNTHDDNSSLELQQLKEYRRANDIADNQLWVNIGLAFVTALLFGISYLQYRSARISANAAIDAVNIAKKQFEIENTPYFSIKKVKLVDFGVNRPIIIQYDIVNVNDRIAQTILIQDLIETDPKQIPTPKNIFSKMKEASSKNGLKNSNSEREYITNESPFTREINGELVSEKFFIEFFNREKSIYWCGWMLYFNPNTTVYPVRRLYWAIEIKMAERQEKIPPPQRTFHTRIIDIKNEPVDADIKRLLNGE